MVKDALRDMHEGGLRYELWLMLGWRDVLSRYRRSRLGPLWIVISMGFVAGVMGLLYSAIMQRPPSDYIPYLVVGFIAWNLLSSFITEGCQVFTANAAAIKEVPLPGTVYVYRLACRNLVIFTHNIVVYILVLLIFRTSPFPAAVLALPGLGLILLNGMWIGLLFGLINARFRDFSQVVNNLMRLLFFVTPVIWYPDRVAGLRRVFVDLNPFYYFVEILRAPLLGEVPSQYVWSFAMTFTLLGWLGTLPVYARWRRQIAYWV